jgi:hypothetical protein
LSLLANNAGCIEALKGDAESIDWIIIDPP